MERTTVAIYEDRGDKWAAGVKPDSRHMAEKFGASIEDGLLRIDVGCGAGRYSGSIGKPCIGLDAARTMLDLCKKAAPDTLLVQADMEALPFGHAVIHGGWANMSYLHLPRKRLPFALADLQRVLTVGSPIYIQVMQGDFEGNDLPDDKIGGRFFSAWTVDQLTDVVVGAGFEVTSTETDEPNAAGNSVVRVTAERLRTLPDTVGPKMRLLVCGLNPSVYSADVGTGFARAGNRFWRAAETAGLVSTVRDPRRALEVDRIGMTDMVKRATPNAAVLSKAEYSDGAARVERLVEWLQPQAVLFVGLAGWRSAVDRRAIPGRQKKRFGGRPAYVMPSTSGLNANSRLGDLIEHMKRAIKLADRSA